MQENNLVAAGMVGRAEEWPWSSARSHIAGARAVNDPLTDVAALGRYVPNWRAMLAIGLEAMDADDSFLGIEARLRSGRPLASSAWIAEAEQRSGRKLGPAKPGRKPTKSEGVAK